MQKSFYKRTGLAMVLGLTMAVGSSSWAQQGAQAVMAKIAGLLPAAVPTKNAKSAVKLQEAQDARNTAAVNALFTAAMTLATDSVDKGSDVPRPDLQAQVDSQRIRALNKLLGQKYAVRPVYQLTTDGKTLTETKADTKMDAADLPSVEQALFKFVMQQATKKEGGVSNDKEVQGLRERCGNIDKILEQSKCGFHISQAPAPQRNAYMFDLIDDNPAAGVKNRPQIEVFINKDDMADLDQK